MVQRDVEALSRQRLSFQAMAAAQRLGEPCEVPGGTGVREDREEQAVLFGAAAVADGGAVGQLVGDSRRCLAVQRAALISPSFEKYNQ
jgi:hypothetical protein